MATMDIREQLHEQIDRLPDEVVAQIADFTLFIMARRRLPPEYADWEQHQWQDFTLAQFFLEDDEVAYSLEDAQEIFRP